MCGPQVAKKGKRRKKKTVGFSADVEEDVLPIKVAMEATEVLLVQPECRRILAMRHRDLLRPLAASLGAAIKKLGDILSPSAPEWFVQDSFSFFTGGQSSPVAVYMKFYELHLRLCAFLSLPGVQTDALSVPLKTEEERALVTALTWCTTNLLPWLKSTARAQKCSSNQVGACSSKASKGTRGKSDDSIETFLEEKRQVLLYLLTVTLKVASNVLMAICVDCTLLDEAVQLCVSLLQCLNSAGTDTLNIPVVSATLRCVYHILSVRMKQDEGQEDLQEKPRETMSKRAKCADIACSCLRLLFKALTDPPAPQEAAEIAGNLEAGMASMDIGEGETEEKRQSIEHSHIESQRSELVKAIASTVSELIVELTKPGQTISVSDKVASMSFRCVLADLERASESSEDLCDPEETKLPPVSTMVLAALKKRAVTVKLFCAELEQCLAGDEVFNIYQAMALVTMVQELKSRDPVLQTPVIYQALKGKVAGASKPAQMDEKDFQALMSKAETTLKHMRSELLGDA